jgi:chromosomal replication initiation ATPase DnaA
MGVQVCLECGQHVFATQHNMMRSIISRIAAGYGLSYDEVTGTSRQRHIVAGRNHVYAALIECGFSSAAVGRYMGRDHSTVLHGAAQHRERVAEILKRAEEQERMTALLGPYARGGDAHEDYIEAFA